MVTRNVDPNKKQSYLDKNLKISLEMISVLLQRGNWLDR